MRRSLIVLIAAACTPAIYTQTQIDLKSQSKGSVDFTAATATKPLKSGTALPSTCNAGELFWKTNAAPGANIYGCTAANTWTAQGGAAAPLAGYTAPVAVNNLQGFSVSAAPPAAGQALVWSAADNEWEPQTMQAAAAGSGAQFASGLGDFAAVRVSNTQVTLAANPAGTAVRCGGSVTTFTGVVTITASGGALGAGSVLYPYVDCSTSPASIRIDTNSAVSQAKLAIAGASFGNANASGYPPDTIPLQKITGGAIPDQFDSSPFTDARAYLSTVVLKCGANLLRTANTDGSYACAVDPTSSLAWSGAADFSAAAATRPSRAVAAEPATCAEGESYYNLTAHQRMDCTAANVWQAPSGLIAFQPLTSALAVGTGDTVIYTSTLPAGSISPGGCATVDMAWQAAGIGSGNITPKLMFGGSAITLYTANNLPDKMVASIDICNLPGSSNQQQINRKSLILSGHATTGLPDIAAAAVNMQQPVTLSLTVNGAGSSGFTVSGLWWKVTRN
jgi:hypothetical protein